MPFSKFLVFMVYKFRDHSPYFTISERMFQELLYRGCTLRHTIVTVHSVHSNTLRDANACKSNFAEYGL